MKHNTMVLQAYVAKVRVVGSTARYRTFWCSSSGTETGNSWLRQQDDYEFLRTRGTLRTRRYPVR